MELFKLKQLDIKSVKKDRLFFDQYQYCLNFKLVEVSALRESFDRASIERTLDNRIAWRSRNRNYGGSWRGIAYGIDDNIKANCFAMADFLSMQTNYKIMFSVDWAYIYSNDLSLLRQIESLNYITPISLKQAVINRPKNTIIIKNSQHDYRSFFRSVRLTPDQKESLKVFLNNQQDIRLSPSLAQCMSNTYQYHYINDNVFIDHNNHSILTMLSLILDRPIRKTIKILHDK